MDIQNLTLLVEEWFRSQPDIQNGAVVTITIRKQSLSIDPPPQRPIVAPKNLFAKNPEVANLTFEEFFTKERAHTLFEEKKARAFIESVNSYKESKFHSWMQERGVRVPDYLLLLPLGQWKLAEIVEVFYCQSKIVGKRLVPKTFAEKMAIFFEAEGYTWPRS